MSNIFFTSDTHFGHNRGFIYEPRGFSSMEEHDETIIENWNKIVKPDDIVYHLGDVMLGDSEYGAKCISRLNGKINLIFGNHDTDSRIKIYHSDCPNIITGGFADRISYEGYHFFLSHYPTNTANLDDSGLKKTMLNLHGHTHQKTDFIMDNPYQYHVGIDSHNNFPVSIEEIIVDIRNKYDECKSYL